MKIAKLVSSMIGMGLLLLPLSTQALETKLSGEFWGRWILENARVKQTDDTYKDRLTKNYMSLERGYLGLETKFTENTKGRFTIDIFSTDKTHEYLVYDPSPETSSTKTGTLDGAGLKIKYAYVDFARLLPVQDLTLTTGMQKVYFGTIYDWNYSLIGKAPTDEYGIASSSDLGITLNGYLPQGFGEYQLGVYNGEGYKKVGASLKDNTSPAYLVNLRITPVSGVTLGGSYMANSVGRDEALNGAVNAAYEQQQLLDGVLRLAYGPIDMWTEYISKSVDFPNAHSEFTLSGLSLFPTLSLKEYLGYDVQLLGRYDIWDQSDRAETDKQRSKLNAITLGTNYNFLHDESANPAMQLQLNYTLKKYDEDESHADFADEKKDSSSINLQLKWRFNSLIAN